MVLVFWNFLLRKVSQNEFTEIDTYTCGGHVPAGRLWSIRGVSVSTNRNIMLQTWSSRCLKWMITGFLFRVLNLNEICTERCEATLLQCILGCESTDTSCLTDCIRDETDCINGKQFIFTQFIWIFILNFLSGCPCELNCSEGCTDCDNPVCQCEVNYIN